MCKRFSESKVAMPRPCKTCPFIGGLPSTPIQKLQELNIQEGQTNTEESFICHQVHRTRISLQCAGFLAFNKQNGVVTPFEEAALEMGMEYDIQHVDNLLTPAEFAERYK